jgi:hypothetical protein
MDRFDLHHPDRFRNLKRRGTGFALAPRFPLGRPCGGLAGMFMNMPMGD